MTQKNTLVIAHRGGRDLAPENTLEAFHLAFTEFRVDMIEFDLRETRDGQIVVIHDESIDRTTNRSGRIRDLSLEEIQACDAGFRFQKPGRHGFPWRGKQVRVPHFEEVLRAFPDRPLAIEIKEPHESLTVKAIELIRRFGVDEHCIIGSKYGRVFHTLRKKAPHLRRFLPRSAVVTYGLHYKTGLGIAPADSNLVASMPPQWKGLRLDSTRWIDYLHSRKIQVFFWDVVGAEQMQTLWQRGADGLVVDDPLQLNHVLGREDETAPRGD